MLLNTFSLTELLPPANTPMSLGTKHARRTEEASRSVDTTATVGAVDSKARSTTPLSQSVLMLQTGAHIDQEPSATADPASTMPSFSSELSVETGRSRTPGEHHGERVDTSDLPTLDQAPVESAPLPVSFPSDLDDITSQILLYDNPSIKQFLLFPKENKHNQAVSFLNHFYLRSSANVFNVKPIDESDIILIKTINLIYIIS